MSIFTSLPQNSDRIVAPTVVALLVLVFASLIAFARRLSRLGKNLERLTQEVDELQRLEERRFLKGLRAEHKSQQDAKIEAPTLAPEAKPEKRQRAP
jgi:biopolymer transport protein ExbB/TolQ